MSSRIGGGSGAKLPSAGSTESVKAKNVAQVSDRWADQVADRVSAVSLESEDVSHGGPGAKHDLKDKTQLLKLIQNFPEGIAVADLEDAYPSVDHDLKALKAAGEIWLSNFGSAAEDMAYPNNHRAIKVDDDLKQLFRGIELPRDMIDIEKDLQKNGMKPATNTAQRRAQTQVQDISNKPEQKKKKKRGISKRTKLTNSHPPELFKDLSC
ncbi:TFIIE beta domain-containing protein [Heracleum sosnowskyi]|uniref:TFIIE beta domain-containing protein n=1 Tax=Heracleum sosnowskyi TaxID=360622 RepID=A0AAD8IH53_9APIA|nr:TFIIE beta domain-containing protein [Heracleum sosnowskyi]